MIRPGAKALSEANALAVTGAMRLEGISTPVQSRPDAGRVHCRRSHRYKWIGIQQLRIVEPRMRET